MAVKLRREFIRTAMVSLLIILLVMTGLLNIINMLNINRRADQMLQVLYDHDGYFPEMMASPAPSGAPGSQSVSSAAPGAGFSPSGEEFKDRDRRWLPFGLPGTDLDRSRDMEAPFETRYFWIQYDKDGTTEELYTDRIASISEEEAVSAGSSLYNSRREKGSYSSFRYRIKEYEDGSRMILFVDRSSSLSDALTLLLVSLIVMSAALIMMYILVRFLSGRAIAPVVDSLEKQKRFISDAGHELKTPISIISANVDVLELTDVKNEWTASIRSQVKRMTVLVNNLLTLSRMEEDTYHPNLKELDLSRLIRETAAPYDAVAAASGLTFTADIEDGIRLLGDERALTQLCTLQLDNAMKYASKKGRVDLTLRSTGPQQKGNKSGGTVVMEIINDCDQLPEGDLSRLFERFYRSDASRNSQTGGHGIGLSVAAAIARAHGGTISASALGDRRICFRTELPCSRDALNS